MPRLSNDRGIAAVLEHTRPTATQNLPKALIDKGKEKQWITQ